MCNVASTFGYKQSSHPNWQPDPRALGVGSRPPGGGRVTGQDPQYSFPSCQESGMCSPVSSAVGEIFSQKQTLSFLIKGDVKDPLTHMGGLCPESGAWPYPFSRRPTWTLLCDTQSIAPHLCVTVFVASYSGERQDSTEKSLHTKDFFFGFCLKEVSKCWKHPKRESLWKQIGPSGRPCLF